MPCISFRGVEPDEKVIAENVAKLMGKLDGYESILKKQEYLAGDVSSRESFARCTEA